MKFQKNILANFRSVIHTGNLLICANEILRKDVRVLHVGAHAAQERKIYTSYGLEDVYWVEPIPHLIKELTRIFSQKYVIPYAVWSKDMKMKLKISKNEVSSSFYGFASTNPFSNLETVNEIEVTTITLNEIIEKKLPLDNKQLILVLDVQGSEYEALLGLDKKNTRNILGMVVEISETPIYEGAATAEQLRKRLKSLGYFRSLSLVRPPTNHGDELFLKKRAMLNVITLIRSYSMSLLIKISLFRYNHRQKKKSNETSVD